MTSPKTFSLQFHHLALDEFHQLDKAIRIRFAKKLDKRLKDPISPANALTGDLKGCFKIKDNESGYRLVYLLQMHELLLKVLSVGKRESRQAYKAAATRLKE